MTRTLSEIYWSTEPPPWWRRALDLFPTDRVERTAAIIAVGYCVAVAVALAAVLRP